MVEKMKLLHITGPKHDIDRVMKQYLNKYEIHFENALTSLGNISGVRAFVEPNMYRDAYQKSQELMPNLDPVPGEELYDLLPQDAQEIVEEAYGHTLKLHDQQEALQKDQQEIKNFMEQIAAFRNLDFEFHKMLDFHFIKFRLGRIPLAYYHKLNAYIQEAAYTMFYECASDEQYVWGVYFVPKVHAVKVDAVYTSFHFEQLYMPDSFEGTPEDAYQEALGKLQANEKKILALTEQMRDTLKEKRQELLSACQSLKDYCENFDIRKLAACTRPKDKGEYFILYGWMAREDAKAFQKEIAEDENVYCIEEGMDGNLTTSPPSKLKNPRLLKPFEMFVEMYGLPAYNEMDPTFFVALTYTLMFGIMFGDVGQGLCLVVGGFLLYRIKGIRLAGIVSIAGIWSTVFGFLYGSFFGFEEVLPTIWMKPMEHIMPTLMMAIAFGGILILIAMVLNIVNAIRSGERGRLLFDQSGIAGLICYGFVALCVALFATGHPLPAVSVIGAAVGIPLIAILLKEPLSHLVERKKEIFPSGSKAMFFVEALVECFDVVLSYATNTISFVRVGAFALSHAGMMGVVLTLSGFESGSPNWIIVVLGNIVVMALEGLVVGIQVLRLEYYEMFSRFYRGSGKPFVNFRSREK